MRHRLDLRSPSSLSQSVEETVGSLVLSHLCTDMIFQDIHLFVNTKSRVSSGLGLS